MLLQGEIDALIHPQPPKLVQTSTDRVCRLFQNPRMECINYFRKHKYYPIMHMLVVKEDVVKSRPNLPRELMQIWDDAKRQAIDFYRDPGFAVLAFARNELEAQVAELGVDPWASGLRANRANLERFVRYMVDQRLIPTAISIESIFHPSVLDT